MASGWLLVIFIALLLLSVPILGRYMAAIFDSQTQLPFFIRWLAVLENLIYRLCGIDPKLEMSWQKYALSLLYFNLLGLCILFFIQVGQFWLPLNPEEFIGIAPVLALNTAISFVTNTDWQAYAGENSLSYFTQMMGLTVQNFLSAASGNATLLALIRGIKRHSTTMIGNFWADLTRTIVYLLLPLSIIFAIFLVQQGVIQNVQPYVHANTISRENQIIPMGPAASQVAIKQLGTNGGGFFNANSAHPFENPTPLSNFFELFAILCIPASATYMYGKLINSTKQGWVIFSVMLVLWFAGVAIAIAAENTLNQSLGANPVLEGQEVRFGTLQSIMWATSTTASSNGATNSMLSSLSPLSGGVAMFNMMIGEIIFGGIGVGLCSMLMFIFLTVFLAGLMVGRTPEYMGKKIEKNEMQWVMIAILTPCALILLGAGFASTLPEALLSVANEGPHGLSEILYAFSSSAGNNGSAFAGINANTTFYNLVLALIMLICRCAIILPSLAIAGSLAQKNIMATSLGTFATDKILFAIVLCSVIIIMGALTFFPAIVLGPLAEQILMLRGRTF